MVPLRVGVLGPVTVWREGREVAAGQPRQLAVLGVLATRANRVVSRGELIDAVWGEKPPASAESGIYTYVAGLRGVLEPDRPRSAPERSRRAPARLLVSAGGGYLLRLPPGCLDSDDFEQCLGRAHGLRTRGDHDGAARAVAEALALWRGLPFAGVTGPFAAAERQRLTELRTMAAEERADLMLAQGKAAAAVAELSALVTAHPLRERASGLLMIGLYRCGRQADALRVFREARERLAEDLGLDPGSELTRIHQQLLAMDPALDGPVTAAPAAVTVAPVTAGPADSVPAGEPSAAAAGASADTAADTAAAAPPSPSPAQLPPEVAGFVGRDAELCWLHALLPGAVRPAGAAAAAAASPAPGPADCPVVVLTGTAGVGKTTLAIRFARQAGPRFPDGQLYVNLRGFDPASAPVEPATALQGFFDALGVTPRRVPVTLEARSALLRTLLDGKRMLLLLDNAHRSEQVRPLLPGSPGCLVVVTSRSQLTGLVAAEGARMLALDVLSSAEATSLLAARLGHDRVTAEPDAAARLAGQSAGLPLALSVTCARAVTRPATTLADLAAELADARGRLDVLRTGEVTTDLRAVFSWSVEKLTEPAARAFRLLGLHPGPDVSVPAVASLTGLALPAARAALDELVRASLLTEEAAGRFSCHDLLRVYQAERAAEIDSEQERAGVRRRLLDYYLRTAHHAAARLYPARDQLPLPVPAPGVAAGEFGAGEYEAALAWFTAEYRVLRNVLELAAAHGADEHCWKLAWYWSPLLKRRGRLHEAAQLQRLALAAVSRLGDVGGLARVHYDLGHVSGRLGDYPAAGEHLRTALELFSHLGDLASVGQARHALAILLEQQDRYAEALGHAVEALRLLRSSGDGAAIAYSENTVGWILVRLGQHTGALRHCHAALELHRESGSKSGMADTLDSIGYAYSGLGEHRLAIDHYEQALVMYRQIGDPDGEARTLLHLGDAQAVSGLTGAARHSWERALALLSEISAADISVAGSRAALAGRLTRERQA